MKMLASQHGKESAVGKSVFDRPAGAMDMAGLSVIHVYLTAADTEDVFVCFNVEVERQARAFV